MSLLKVDTVQGRSGTNISVASGNSILDSAGKTLSNGMLEFDQWAMTARTSAWERVENATVGSSRRGYLMLEGVRIVSYGTLLCEAGDRRDVGV